MILRDSFAGLPHREPKLWVMLPEWANIVRVQVFLNKQPSLAH